MSDDRLDELLDDPPRGDHHLGRFAGDRAGRKVRALMATVLGLAIVSAAWVWWRHTVVRAHERTHPFELPADVDVSTRPREMTWSGGKARLGLSREAPGIEVIHLPDRDIRLAGGCERAQIKVDVRDGQTVALKVISGEIEQEPR